MQERRQGDGDERLITTQAQAGAAIGQHLRQTRIGWEDAGYRVLGVALAWTAARLLRDITGIRCEALISLQRDIYIDPEIGSASVLLTGKNMLVVNEIGIDHDRKGAGALVTAAGRAGARLVLVRDPCQHRGPSADA